MKAALILTAFGASLVVWPSVSFASNYVAYPQALGTANVTTGSAVAGTYEVGAWGQHATSRSRRGG